MELLFAAATSLAQAQVPLVISQALMGARLTALSTTDGGVRGIATGTTLQRLVASALAKQFMKEFEGVRTVPVRTVDTSRHRLCRAPPPCSNRCRSRSYYVEC